jgi:hypothetical protein
VRSRALIGLLLAPLVAAPASDLSAQDEAKGAVLIAAAREAIGGRNRLADVKTLQMTGTFRRVIGGNDTEGDFEIFLELPDKYLRSEKTGTPGQPSTETIEALVGAEPRDVVRGGGRVARPAVNAGGGDDASGGDAAAAPPADAGEPGQPAEPNPAPARGRSGPGADPEALRRGRQADVARFMLMVLLRSDVPVTWIGIAESPDGKADVLEARFADGQPTRLFVDTATRMPLMLQWQGAPNRAALQAARRGGAGGQRGRAQGAPPERITFEMTFSDHRTVNGIRLPFLVTRGMNDQTIEQWTVRSYRVNPAFRPDTFTR